MSLSCPGGCGLTYTVPPDRYCHRCGDYLADLHAASRASTTDPSPATRDNSQIADTRSEKEIEAAIMKALQMLGWTVYKTSQPQKPVGMSPGIPDLYVAGHGVTAWLEVKRPAGRQSEAQEGFERTVSEHGAHYRIVRSETEAIQWAEDIRNPNTWRTA